MTLYLATASGPSVTAAMRGGALGQLCTPRSRTLPLPGVTWAADNGCYSASEYVGDDAWAAWLRRLQPHRDRCLFAVAPDVVGDAAATLQRSAPHLQLIRELGYPAAFVAQDGQEHLPVPWATFDWLFIGGSTAWKLGPHAAALCAEARRRGVPVHVGRVNSAKRYRYVQHLGAATCDGTLLAFGPDKHLPAVVGWQQHAPLPFGEDTACPTP